MRRKDAGEQVQELEGEKEEVQQRLTSVRNAASHVARHSRLQQERPALQQAVQKHSADWDSHKAEACLLIRTNLLNCMCMAKQRS
jgi:hypothetical protein